jgi:hypothetical protein
MYYRYYEQHTTNKVAPTYYHVGGGGVPIRRGLRAPATNEIPAHPRLQQRAAVVAEGDHHPRRHYSRGVNMEEVMRIGAIVPCPVLSSFFNLYIY